MKRKSTFLKVYFSFLAILVLSFNLVSVVSADGSRKSDNKWKPKVTTTATRCEPTTKATTKTTEETTQTSTEATSEETSQTPTESATEATTQTTTESTTEATSQTPTESATEATTQAATESTSEETSQTPTESATEATTEQSSETTAAATSARTSSTSSVAVFGETFVSSNDPTTNSIIVEAGEMPSTGDSVYPVKVIAFLTLLLIGTLLIFWKYKIQEEPINKDKVISP